MTSCTNLPDKIEPVKDFDLNKYMGTWYEIARLDHRFERGLENVTATYTMNPDGSVRVKNKGFSINRKKWESVTGKAKFSGDKSIGSLQVSFFGPLYGPYVIFELDKLDYQYAFVTSGENYLWLLARNPTVSNDVKEKFISTAKDVGYNTGELIFVNHE